MRTRQFWFSWAGLFILLAGCVPSAAPQVDNPQDMVATIAAATVAALPTNTPQPSWTPSLTPTRARNTPTDLPSNTPAPTIDVFPTATSVYDLPGPGTLLPGTPGAVLSLWTSTPEPYQCDLNKTDPEPYTIFKPGQFFRAEWRVWNRGSIIWKEKSIIFYYIGGDKLHNDVERAEGINLGYAVYPEDKILVSVAMTSPKEPGTYSATWGLRRDNRTQPFCTFSIVIRVR